VFAAFVSLDSLVESSMLSGHVYFHSHCFMDVEDIVHSWYLAGGSLDRAKYLLGASIEGMMWRDA